MPRAVIASLVALLSSAFVASALAQQPARISSARAIQVARAAWDAAAWGPLPGDDRGAQPPARLVAGAELAREARDHGWELRRGTEQDVTSARRVWSVFFQGALGPSAAFAVDPSDARVLAIYLVPEG